MDSQDPIQAPVPPTRRPLFRHRLRQIAVAWLGALFVFGIVFYIVRLALRL